MNRHFGFSLIELMVAIAILGILTAIALPSYIGYVNRGKAQEGPAQLMDWRARMEQYYQDNRTYDGGCAATAPTAANVKYFAYACPVAATATTYTLGATSIAPLLGKVSGDYTYTVTESNVKATTKFNGTVTALSCFATAGPNC